MSCSNTVALSWITTTVIPFHNSVYPRWLSSRFRTFHIKPATLDRRLPLHHTRQPISNFQIECSRTEFNVLPHHLGPFVSCCVRPADQVKMINVCQCTKVCALPQSILIMAIVDGLVMHTHFDDSTETNPSFGPSFSRITEWGHLHGMGI